MIFLSTSIFLLAFEDNKGHTRFETLAVRALPLDKKETIVKSLSWSFAVLTILLLCSVSAAVAPSTTFTATLSGKNEVPAVDTPATGSATFELSQDGAALNYTLSVSNVSDVTMAHIHIGAPGAKGEHVAPLYPEPTGAPMGGMSNGMNDAVPSQSNMASPKRMNGVIAKGTIHASDLGGSLQGKTIADLVAAIKSGNAYVNVHTKAHADGEIRGQIQ